MNKFRYEGNKRAALLLLASGDQPMEVADQLDIELVQVYRWMSSATFLHDMAIEAALMELRDGTATGCITMQ